MEDGGGSDTHVDMAPYQIVKGQVVDAHVSKHEPRRFWEGTTCNEFSASGRASERREGEISPPTAEPINWDPVRPLGGAAG